MTIFKFYRNYKMKSYIFNHIFLFTQPTVRLLRVFRLSPFKRWRYRVGTPRGGTPYIQVLYTRTRQHKQRAAPSLSVDSTVLLACKLEHSDMFYIFFFTIFFSILRSCHGARLVCTTIIAILLCPNGRGKNNNNNKKN